MAYASSFCRAIRFTQGELGEGSAIGSTADSWLPAVSQNDSAGEPGDTCETRTPPEPFRRLLFGWPVVSMRGLVGDYAPSPCRLRDYRHLLPFCVGDRICPPQPDE